MFPSEAVRNLEVIREHLVPTRKPVVQITVWSWIVHHWIRDTSVFTASLQELKLIRIKKDKKFPSLIWQGNFFLRTVLLWQINRSANAINTISNHSFQAFFLPIRDHLQQDCLHVMDCTSNALLFWYLTDLKSSIFDPKCTIFLPITFAQSAGDTEREDVSNVCVL